MKPERRKPKLTLVKRLGKAQKLTRAQKQSQIRAALLEAAAKVVGEVGYSAAMVSTITRRAGVAQGTFYNYFNSRQDLFDQLLPSMSDEMLAFIKGRCTHATNDVAREKLRFEAYFAYLLKRPSSTASSTSPELFSPEAFQKHIDVIARGYRRVLQRAADAGDARAVDTREYEVLAVDVDGNSKVSLKPLCAIERLHPGIAGFRHEGLHALRLQWLLGRPRQHREPFAREKAELQIPDVGRRSLTAKRASDPGPSGDEGVVSLSCRGGLRAAWKSVGDMRGRQG